MELRHLRYFLAVAEVRSFRRAAEKLFVSQSALSQQISRLEAEVGTSLFFRSTRHVSLTPAGEMFRPLARRVLADVEHAEWEMAAYANVQQGRLRLGIIQTGARAVDIVELISTFHDHRPGIDLYVRTGASSDLAAAVEAGELDLAIVALPLSELPAGLTYERIVDDPLVAVMSSAAAGEVGEEISLAELLERGPFIHYLRGSGLRHSVTTAFERFGLHVDPAFELDQFSDMVRLAARGVGVTLVPGTFVEPVPGEAQQTAEFAIVRLADPLVVHPVGVVHRPDRLSPAAAEFLETVHQAAVDD